MLDINRVTLLGHAGRDPEIRNLQSGNRAASFSLATTSRWKRPDGQPAQATEWHRIVVFGGAVKTVEDRVREGATVLVEGRLARREYRDRENNVSQVTEVVVAGPLGMVNIVTPGRGRDRENPNAPETSGGVARDNATVMGAASTGPA